MTIRQIPMDASEKEQIETVLAEAMAQPKEPATVLDLTEQARHALSAVIYNRNKRGLDLLVESLEIEVKDYRVNLRYKDADGKSKYAASFIIGSDQTVYESSIDDHLNGPVPERE